MDINQLEVLVTVAREKSFSRAAEMLNRTQPAVSQAISRLELDLGEKLFDRSSKDGTLTPAGEVLLDYAKQMLNLRRSAETALRELADLHRGKVTISANEHTVFYLLPLIAEFRKRHPLVKIEVSRGVASRIPSEVTSREVELGVLSFKPSDTAVKSIPVLKDELVLICAPSHPFAGRKSVRVSELGDETFIAHNARSPYRESVIETFASHKTRLRISIELPSLEAIKRLVETGIGVALVPKLSALAEINDGRLSAVSVTEMKLQRSLHIVYRRNSALSHAAQAFLELAKEMADIK
ncbi:MAG: LysR family transcriptional regulator [Pyrinomonadaceae bacterium]|nr:LysR family transcriptional regulator [Pyrinomonadaceae bacterium]